MLYVGAQGITLARCTIQSNGPNRVRLGQKMLCSGAQGIVLARSTIQEHGSNHLRREGGQRINVGQGTMQGCDGVALSTQGRRWGRRTGGAADGWGLWKDSHREGARRANRTTNEVEPIQGARSRRGSGDQVCSMHVGDMPRQGGPGGVTTDRSVVEVVGSASCTGSASTSPHGPRIGADTGDGGGAQREDCSTGPARRRRTAARQRRRRCARRLALCNIPRLQSCH